MSPPVQGRTEEPIGGVCELEWLHLGRGSGSVCLVWRKLGSGRLPRRGAMGGGSSRWIVLLEFYTRHFEVGSVFVLVSAFMFLAKDRFFDFINYKVCRYDTCTWLY
jgi:hypothetical protein